MSSITFKLANAAVFEGKETAYVLGKNGFDQQLGVVKPLVTSVSVTDANIVFTASNLHLLHDDNFDCHIFEARDNAQYVAGTNQISDNIVKYKLNSKAQSSTAGLLEGLVGYESTLTQATSNISSYDISANTFNIAFDSASSATFIKNKLLPIPFYVDLFQLIDKRFSSSNTFFVSGDLQTVSNVHNVTTQSGTVELQLNCNPAVKGLIKTYINGSIYATDPIQYTFNSGDSYVTHNLATDDVQIETIVEDYVVPHLELGDSVFLRNNEQFNSIYNSSYDPTSATYNIDLTASDFFKVTFNNNLASNTGSTVVTNITPDLFASISNVDLTANTVTVTYDEVTTSASYNLANNRIYSVAPVSLNSFSPVSLNGSELEDLGVGAHIIKVSAINERNRISSPVTKTAIIKETPLGRTENLTLTEILFRDRTKGVMSRVQVIFDHIRNRNITNYDLSYRILLESGSDPHPSGMTNFNTVSLSAEGRDTADKMRYTIDNLDLGAAGNIYKLQVRVVPTNGDVSGIEYVEELTLTGKSDNPLNVTNFVVSQSDTTLIFEVDYPVDSASNLDELDILHTEIRFKTPTVPTTDTTAVQSAFANGDVLLLIPHPLTRQEISIDKIGEGSFTFTAKTVDTSGNKAANAVAENFSVSLSSTTEAIVAYNEAAPNVAVSSSIVNSNYGDNNFVSVNESDNGGFVYDVDPITSPIVGSDTPSTVYEDANATASGFSWSSQSGDTDRTDLLITSSNASYISPVRDLGSTIKGSLVVSSSVSSNLLKTVTELSEVLIEGVSEASPSANVLFDADFEIGTVVGYSNTEHTFSFSSTHSTIVDNSANTRIFAILNPGQEVVGEVEPGDDISNVYSYAFIAGAINAYAVELSNVYFANGQAVPLGNASSSTALSNLTQSGNTYKLIDLSQFTDTFGSLDFTPDITLSKNTFARFSSANVFSSADAGSSKPHGNVDPDLFTSTSLDGNWTKQVSGVRQFRYFQVRVDLDIDNYDENNANAFLDELSYEVLAQRKTFSTTVTTTGNILGNSAVDYSSTSFYNIPDVITQVLSEGSYIAKTSSLTNQGCNVRIIDTTTGNIVTTEGIEILVTALGA